MGVLPFLEPCSAIIFMERRGVAEHKLFLQPCPSKKNCCWLAFEHNCGQFLPTIPQWLKHVEPVHAVETRFNLAPKLY